MSNTPTSDDVKIKSGRRSLRMPLHGDCQICGQPGHGSHFGVLACRACAAFFRRTVVLNRQYSCRRANGSCQISKNERYICRLCRYKKCLALGMTPENVQYNRDVLSTTVEGGKVKNVKDDATADDEYDPQGVPKTGQSKDEYIAGTNGATRTIMEPVNSKAAESSQDLKKAFECRRLSVSLKESGPQRFFIDISLVMKNLSRVFTEFHPEIDLPKEPLECMRRALLRHRREQLSEPDLNLVESLSFAEMLSNWEQQIYAMGEWMMHCKEFAVLPLQDKLTIFKTSYVVWQQFERTTMSIDLFGWRAVTEKLLAFSSKIAMVHDRTMKFDISPITDCDPSYVRSLFDPFAGRMIEEVAKTCLDLAISPMEATYILCTLIWHVEGKPVAPATILVAESYREMISDDLHNYYMRTLKTPNYAARLIRIMSIVHCIENIYYERSKIMELARIFDVFKTDISERGLFG